jgi:hypothetical protein
MVSVLGFEGGCFQGVIRMCLACHLKLKRTFVIRLRYSQPEV